MNQRYTVRVRVPVRVHGYVEMEVEAALPDEAADLAVHRVRHDRSGQFFPHRDDENANDLIRDGVIEWGSASADANDAESEDQR